MIVIVEGRLYSAIDTIIQRHSGYAVYF